MYNLLSTNEINQINNKYKTRQEDEIVKLRKFKLQDTTLDKSFT